jgi:hypothetical protein
MLLENLQAIQSSMPELALTAVRQNGLALKYAVNKTPELCIEAVRQNGEALCYVPMALREQVKQAAGIA